MENRDKMLEKELVKYSLEAILQVFRIINKKIEDFKKIDDLYGIEKLEREVIPLYENFYGGLKELYLNFDESSFEKKEFETIRKNIDNILMGYFLDKCFIEEQMELREKYENNSGSEIVKNLFEYEKKELLFTKGDFTKKVNELLDTEERLNQKLCDTIQEVDQLEIIDELLTIREKYREVEEQFLVVNDRISELENKLEKKWYYEIYGTISKEEMLKIYKNR